MAISKIDFERSIDKAFRSRIDDWQEKVARAIENTQMELLSDAPEIFRTAAWINFGISSAKYLAPISTTVEAVISKYSLHVWAANTMLDGLKELYKRHAKNFNRLLRVHHKIIKSSLIRGTEQLKIKFPISPLAQKSVSQVMNISIRRINEPSLDVKLAQVYLETLIHKSELLDSAENPIGRRIQKCVAELSRKVKNVYEGSKYGWGEDKLFYMDKSIAYCDDRVWRDPFSGEITPCRPYLNKISGGSTHGTLNTHKSEKFAELLANIWKYDVKLMQKLSAHDIAYAKVNPNAKSPMQLVEDALRSDLKGSKEKLQEVESEAWAQVTSVAENKSNFSL